MKPQELRIGNYVNVTNQSQCPFKIDGFEFSNKTNCKIFQGENPNQHPLTWYFQDLSPILLTEEWLLKFGAYKGINNWFRITITSDVEICTLNINSFSFSTCLFGKDAIEPSFIKNCYFVHELQNLYFSLTGEELTIKAS